MSKFADLVNRRPVTLMSSLFSVITISLCSVEYQVKCASKGPESVKMFRVLLVLGDISACQTNPFVKWGLD